MATDSAIAEAAGPASPAAGRRRVVSALAWSALLAAAMCAAAAALAGLGHRWGWWDYRAGLVVLVLAAGGAALATAAAAVAAFLSLRRGRRALVLTALAALLIGAATTAPVIHALLQARKVPPIHDISTDTADPPAFAAVLALRRDAPNPAEYGGTEVARQQRQFYPDILPLEVALGPDAAFARALDGARALGWEIVAAEPAEGRIEATATTLWFGFKDDVVIRIRPAPGGSRIDVRSVSRVGRSDLGANAGRIRRYLTALGGPSG